MEGGGKVLFGLNRGSKRSSFAVHVGVLVLIDELDCILHGKVYNFHLFGQKIRVCILVSGSEWQLFAHLLLQY